MFILFFITIPLIDIYLFFRINSTFGFYVNVIEILLSFVAGLFLMNGIRKNLAKKFSYLTNIQFFLENSEMSAKRIFFSFIGSIFLIFPGLYSDIIGVICFSNYFQSLLTFLLLKNIFNKNSFNLNNNSYQDNDNDVFDGVYHYVEEDKKKIMHKDKNDFFK